jgi:hypothetical protein
VTESSKKAKHVQKEVLKAKRAEQALQRELA